MTTNFTNNGIFLSSQALAGLHPEVRKVVLQAVFGEEPLVLSGGSGSGDETASLHSGSLTADASGSAKDDDEEGFVELTPRMARRFVEGCGEKTKLAVETMARSSNRLFQLKDVAAALKVPAPELRGVWGGLTRRVKTVTGDNEAYLIKWVGYEAILDEAGNYIDQTGELTEMTYQSFKKVFGF